MPIRASDMAGQASYTLISGNKQFPLEFPAIMGILNVTPDSFSGDGTLSGDGGLGPAIVRGMDVQLEGASIIDVGGESTHPGSEPISLKEELRRVIPIVETLVEVLSIPISIDTTKPEVAEACLRRGAHIINDVGGLRDENMRKVAAKFNAPVVIMHMQGTPQTMQIDPWYRNVVKDVFSCLHTQSLLAKMSGIQQIIVDPGIGFGKNLEHNLLILRDLAKFRELGFPLLVGPSRKGFIGAITGRPVDERLFGTLAAVTACVLHGADIVRVHDVAACKEAILVADAARKGQCEKI